MSQPAKSHEPSMEEILASIRRIIADDDVKPEEAAAPAQPAPAPKAPPPAAAAPKPAPAPPPKPAAPAPVAKAPEPKLAPPPATAPAAGATNGQDDIDALLAGLDAETAEEEVRSAPAPVAAAVEDDEEDVLELTEQMEVAEEEPESFKTIQPQDDIEFSEAAEPKAVEPQRRSERPHVPVPPAPVRAFEESEPAQPQAPLVSPQTATAVNSAFNALAQTVLSNNARTLEDLVKEMLRPMLQGWLDDNLPGLVEKIVRAEIERVSRGR